jgi:hypothetical protein
MIGAMPSKPIIYVGITSEISESSTLIATSRPIPTYCHNVTSRTGKVNEEKNIMITKISSMLVAAKADIPIAIRLTISVLSYSSILQHV